MCYNRLERRKAKAMAASYTTLSPADRILTCIPRNAYSVSVTRGTGYIRAAVKSFQGDRVMEASFVGPNCYDVRVENYPHRGGKRGKLGKVVEFTTTGDFVEQWIDMAHSEALGEGQ